MGGILPVMRAFLSVSLGFVEIVFRRFFVHKTMEDR